MLVMADGDDDDYGCKESETLGLSYHEKI